MTEPEYNPNDLAFLASRSLDEKLGGADEARLHTALHTDPVLEADARDFRAVDSLVRAWSKPGADLVPENFVDSVLGRIADDHDEHQGALDRLLGTWMRKTPSVDEHSFVDAVRRRVERKRLFRRRPPLVHRLGLPLAAAASVALALSAGLWFQAGRRPVIEVSIGRMTEAEVRGLPRDQRASRVVLYDRTTVATEGGSAVGADVSFGVIGVGPVARRLREVPPI